jgi:hypothetical protein
MLGIMTIFFISYLYRLRLPELEQLNGFLLNDFVLKKLPSYDMSLPIFIFLYGTLFMVYLFFVAYPLELLWMIWITNTAMIFRLIALHLVHLEAPADMITLIDPILTYTTYNGVSFRKDLFFSGHTISIVVAYLCFPYPKLKTLILLIGIALSILLLIQKIHWTIDVICAWLVCYMLYKLYVKIYSLYFNNQYQYSLTL